MLDPTGVPIRGSELFETRQSRRTDVTPLPPRHMPSRFRRRTNSRTPRTVDAGRADYTAVYRLYSPDALLYVGMSNNPLERFIEHRTEKEWWPQVTLYSVEWFDTRAEAEIAEEDAIKDEWPLHNIAHQPRSSGPLVLPSYVVGQLVEAVRDAVESAMIGDATDEQVEEAIRSFRASFDPCMFPDAPIHFRDPRITNADLSPLDLQSVIDALGPFRPPVATSLRTAPKMPPADPRDPRDVLASERVVLGSMFADNSIIDRIAGRVGASDFSRPAEGVIFASIIELHRRGEPVTASAVDALVGDREELSGVGTSGYLARLSSAVVETGTDPADALRFVEVMVAAASLRRRVQRVA